MTRINELKQENIGNLQKFSAWWHQAYRAYLWISRKEDSVLISLQSSIGNYPPHIFKKLYRLHLAESAFNKAKSELDSCNGKDVEKKQKAFDKAKKHFIDEAIRYSVAKLRYSDKYYSPLVVLVYFFHSSEKKQLLNEIKDKCCKNDIVLPDDFYTNSLVYRYASYKVIEHAELKKDGIQYDFDSPDIFLLKEQIKYAEDINNNFSLSVKVAKSEAISIKESIKNNHISLLQAKTREAQINSRKSYKTLSFLKCLWYKASFIFNSMKLWYYGSSLKSFSIGDDALKNHINDLHSEKNELYNKLKLLNSYSSIFNTTKRKKQFVSDVKDIIKNNVNYTDLSKVKNKVLNYASSEGHLELTKDLISNYGADINYKNAQGKTALLHAYKYGFDDLVCILLDREDLDVDINGLSSMLLDVLSKGDTNVAEKILLYPGIDINHKDSAGKTPLAYAHKYRLESLACALLDREDLTVDTNSLSNMLFDALCNGDVKVAKKIISHPRTDINHKDANGKTALLHAYKYGFDDLVCILLDREDLDVDISGLSSMLLDALSKGDAKLAEQLISFSGIDVNYKDDKGKTPLIYAHEYRLNDLACLLLDREDLDTNAKDLSNMLFEALSKGDVKVAKKIISHSSTDINHKDSNGKTALLHAYKYGFYDLVYLLLDREDLDIDINGLSSMLLDALYNGDTKLADKLLSFSRIDVNYKDSNGKTPLIYMSMQDDVGIIIKLLGYSSLDINHKDNDGKTALMYAYECPDHVVKYFVSTSLLERPDLNAVANDLNGLLMKALYDDEIIAEDFITHPDIDINHQDSKGKTPLVYVSMQGDVDIAKKILDHSRVDINHKDNDGKTALMWAYEKEHNNLVYILLERKDLDTAANNLSSMLLDALSKGNSELARKILNHDNIDINYQDKNGKTPLIYASMQDDVNTAKKILDHSRVDINHKDSSGKTALLYAHESRSGILLYILLEQENIDITVNDLNNVLINLLFQRKQTLAIKIISYPGIDINHKDSMGKTFLMHALSSGLLEVVKKIIALDGIDINYTDNTGKTALMYAACQNDLDILAMILFYPLTNMNILDSKGRDALMHAKINNNSLVSEFLLMASNLSTNEYINYKFLLLRILSCDKFNNDFVNTRYLELLLKLNYTDVNCEIYQNKTPLMYSISKNIFNKWGVVSSFLKCQKVNINYQNKEGKTALTYAFHEKEMGIVSDLLSHQDIDLNYKDNEGKTYLMYAVCAGDVSAVRKLSSLTDVNQQDSYGKTALRYAFYEKYIDINIVTNLLSCKDIDLNYKDNEGKSYLRHALHYNDKKPIEALLSSKDIDINHQDNEGKTALEHAFCEKNMNVIEYLISHKDINLNYKDNKGKSYLMHAVHCDDKKLIGVLLSSKDIDINHQDNEGKTALAHAFCENNMNVIGYLISHKDIKLNCKDNEGKTYLMYAACAGNMQAVIKLRSRIGVNQKDLHGKTALMYAFCKKKIDVVENLLSLKDIDLNCKDNEGKTALMHALHSYSSHIIIELLSHEDIDLNCRDNEGKTALTHALFENDYLLYHYLLTHKDINFNYEDNEGKSYLIHAVYCNDTKPIKVLLPNKDIDINHQDNEDKTALIHAVCINNLESVKELLSNIDIDINSKDSKGRTALMHAFYKGHIPIAKELLLHRNIDLNCSDNEGKSLRDYAEEYSKESSDLFMMRYDLQSDNYKDIFFDMLDDDIRWLKLLLDIKGRSIDLRIENEEGNTALAMSVYNGNSEAVELLLDNPDIYVNTNFLDDEGRNALSHAISKEYISIAKKLLPYFTFKIDSTDINGKTALMYAAAIGNLDLVEDLLMYVSDINIIDAEGKTALIHASDNDNTEVVQKLLQCENIDINHADNEDKTALAYSLIKGYSETSIELLYHKDIDFSYGEDALDYYDKYIDYNSSNEVINAMSHHLSFIKSQDMLFHLISNREIEELQIFLKMNALKFDLNATDSKGKTALTHAISEDWSEIVEILLESFADINFVDTKGKTPLIYASNMDSARYAEKLLEYKNININHKDREGKTALMYAASDRCVSIVKKLLERDDIDINQKDISGKTALMHAISEGCLEITEEILLNKDINVSCKDNNDKTALDYASENCIEAVNMITLRENLISDESVLFHIISHNLEKWLSLFLEIKGLDTNLNCTDEEGKTPLIYAASSGNEEIVKKLLSTKIVDVNAKDSKGKTALMHAVYERNLEIVEILSLRKDTDVLCKDLEQKSAMDYSSNNDKEILLNIFSSRSNIYSNNYKDLLFIMAENGSEEWLQFFLEIKGLNVNLNLTDQNGKTLLIHAASKGHIQFAKKLLEIKNININHKDNSGNTALSYAFNENCFDIIEGLLLHKNMDLSCEYEVCKNKLNYYYRNDNLRLVIRIIRSKFDVEGNSESDNYKDILFELVSTGSAKCLELLLKVHGSEINLNIKDIDGRTALATASHLGNIEAIKLLLENKYIYIDPCLPDKEGRTPLIHAACNGHLEIVEKLLSYNTDPNYRDREGKTALIHAASNGHVEVVKKLKDFCDDITSIDSALMHAASIGCLIAVDILLPYIKDINCADIKGKTALIYASIRGDMKLVEYLLSNGSDVNYKDRLGKTALIYASDRGYLEIVEILLNYNADINHQDHFGKTALTYASYNSNNNVVIKLLSKAHLDVNINDREGKNALDYVVEQISKITDAQERSLVNCHIEYIIDESYVFALGRLTSIERHLRGALGITNISSYSASFFNVDEESYINSLERPIITGRNLHGALGTTNIRSYFASFFNLDHDLTHYNISEEEQEYFWRQEINTLRQKIYMSRGQ